MVFGDSGPRSGRRVKSLLMTSYMGTVIGWERLENRPKMRQVGKWVSGLSGGPGYLQRVAGLAFFSFVAT